ncbi:hypothetical protein AB1Y20_023712 [Prymnesium parvum]|uniref:Uncharacterized protein n=1 Tax=Prymnesium parvum TaxID=97485 RepID=A0AB34JG62_PRYPA
MVDTRHLLISMTQAIEFRILLRSCLFDREEKSPRTHPSARPAMPFHSFLHLAVCLPLAHSMDLGGVDWRHFAAGGLSAALSHGYTTPIDVVKTRMQTNPELYNGSLPLALRKIVEDDGAMFLLSGLAPTCLGYGIEGALKFGCYELSKPLFSSLTEIRLLNFVLSSVLAGAVASIALCPAEDVRIRLVANPSYANGALDGLRRIARESGPLASFGGFGPMLCKQVPYTTGKQVSFDLFCKAAHALVAVVGVSELQRHKLTALVPLIAALPAAVLACVLSHPGDMLLTRYYRDQEAGRTRSVLHTLRSVYREGGVRALFLGIQARLLHVIGILWVQLVVYDQLKQWLGLPPTGH